ncbi:MAG: hypothetical protein NT108_02170 [Candidatus Kaiserbacteria bacterium]|nr:hypothetical protein [Candidatus Kaiserbacteria bacterium]
MREKELNEFLDGVDGTASVVVVELEKDNDPIVVLPGQTIRDMFSTLGIFPEQVRNVMIIGKFPDITWVAEADIRGSIAEAIAKAFLAGILTERRGAVPRPAAFFPLATVW